MSSRIVVLGPMMDEHRIEAVEVNSLDADALVSNSDAWRVSLTRWGGPLADATVIVNRGGDPDRIHSVAPGEWISLMRIMPTAHRFEIQIPIALGAS